MTHTRWHPSEFLWKLFIFSRISWECFSLLLHWMEPDSDYREFFTHFHAFNGHGIEFTTRFSGSDRDLTTNSGQNEATAAFFIFSTRNFLSQYDFKILRQFSSLESNGWHFKPTNDTFGRVLSLVLTLNQSSSEALYCPFESIHLKFRSQNPRDESVAELCQSLLISAFFVNSNFLPSVNGLDRDGEWNAFGGSISKPRIFVGCRCIFGPYPAWMRVPLRLLMSAPCKLGTRHCIRLVHPESPEKIADFLGILIWSLHTVNGRKLCLPRTLKKQSFVVSTIDWIFLSFSIPKQIN